jgi:hypothetical protein
MTAVLCGSNEMGEGLALIMNSVNLLLPYAAQPTITKGRRFKPNLQAFRAPDKQPVANLEHGSLKEPA